MDVILTNNDNLVYKGPSLDQTLELSSVNQEMVSSCSGIFTKQQQTIYIIVLYRKRTYIPNCDAYWLKYHNTKPQLNSVEFDDCVFSHNIRGYAL